MLGPVILLLSIFILGMCIGWQLCLKAINHFIKDIEESERVAKAKQFSRYPNE